MLKVLVDPDGSPKEVRVAISSGTAELDAAAKEAASQWSFNPGRSNDSTVGSWVQVPISFSLDQPPAPPAPPAPVSAPAPPAPPVPVRPALAPAPHASLKQSSVSYRRMSPPEYPAEAKAARQEGAVILQVGVGADGAVETVNIVRGTGVELLDKAASDPVEGWTFNPAIEDGR